MTSSCRSTGKTVSSRSSATRSSRPARPTLGDASLAAEERAGSLRVPGAVLVVRRSVRHRPRRAPPGRRRGLRAARTRSASGSKNESRSRSTRLTRNTCREPERLSPRRRQLLRRLLARRRQELEDSTVPMSFTRNPSSPREYWQAAATRRLAGHEGNAYISCQVFNRGGGTSPNPDQSSGFVVMRSTQKRRRLVQLPGSLHDGVLRPVWLGLLPRGQGADGGRRQSEQPVPRPDLRHLDGIRGRRSAYIYETHSDDYGETFSPRVLVSTDNPTLCDQNYGVPTPNGQCNENQDSDPFVGPDGSLYVAYNNYNTLVSGNENKNRVLLVKSTDGGNTFGSPVLVSDYYDLPDCNTYQGAGADSFRACVPEKGSSTVSVFRATNYPSGAVNPKNPNQVAVTFGSYINKHSNESNGCVPTGFSSSTGINALHRRQDAGSVQQRHPPQRLRTTAERASPGRRPTRVRRRRSTRIRARRHPTSGGSGRRSRRTASSRSTTTTGSTARTRRPAGRTSRCPAARIW